MKQTDPQEARQVLGTTFNLTPTEARIVAHLMTGASLRSCAQALGFKYQTVRTYLKSVFHKTGTHRQAQLILIALSAMKNIPQTDPPKGAPAHGEIEGGV